MSEVAEELLEETYADGKAHAFEDVAYHLPRFVTGINPNASCPECLNAIGMGSGCKICNAANEVMRR